MCFNPLYLLSLLMLQLFHLWSMVAYSSWFLSPFNGCYHSLTASLLSGEKRYSKLTLYISPKIHGNFQWQVVCKDHNLGTRGAHYYWVSHCFQTSVDRTRKCVLIFQINVSRRKALRIDAYTDNSNSGKWGFHLISSITPTPRIMFLNDINIFIHLLSPTQGQDQGEAVWHTPYKIQEASASEWCRCMGQLLKFSALPHLTCSPDPDFTLYTQQSQNNNSNTSTNNTFIRNSGVVVRAVLYSLPLTSIIFLVPPTVSLCVIS